MYLKLLESRREGGKIKQRQLINLSESVQIQSDKIKLLFEDLNQTLAFLKSIDEMAPPSYRYLKASYIMALENAFKIEQRCPEQDFKEILLRDGKRKYINNYDEKVFRELICSRSQRPGDYWSIVHCLENLNLFLFDGNGFPLSFIHKQTREAKEIAEYLLKFRNKRKKPHFFLGNACEILYKSFGHMASQSGCPTKELFVYNQSTDWSGKGTQSFNKMLVFETESSQNDDEVSVALMALNSFKNQMEYVNNRMAPITITGVASMSEQDFNCTYFLSYLFKKIFDDIRKKYDI